MDHDAGEVHARIADVVERAVVAQGMLPVPTDTHCPEGLDAQSAAAGLEELMREAKVVVTSRLHGAIHSLRAGVVPVLIDEVESGGKVTSFAQAFGLPVFIRARECDERAVARAIEQTRALPDELAASLLARLVESARANVRRLVTAVKSDLA